MIFDLRELKKHSFQLLNVLLSDIYVTGDQRQHSGSEIFDEQTQIKESAFSRIFHPSRFLQKNKPVYLVFADEPLSRLQYLIARWEDERDADTSAIHAISPSFAMSCASEWHHSPERSQTSCLQRRKKVKLVEILFIFFPLSHTYGRNHCRRTMGPTAGC